MSDSLRLLGAVRVTARYRAPAQDGGILIEPPVDRMAERVAANIARFESSPVLIAGVPLAEFRRQAVAEIAGAARQYLGDAVPVAGGSRLFVAGHQPEFFHPGVWVKNFVLHGVAKRHDGIPLNLIVDNDSIHSPAVRVPIVAKDAEHIRAHAIEYDRPGRDLPYEEYHVADRSLFDSFPDRLAAATKGWGFEPFASSAWPRLKAEVDRGVTFAEALSRVRRAIERSWDVTNLELPVSKLAATRAFTQFVYAVLSDLPRFVDCYNAAIRSYRTANHLRSLNHPAPELAKRGDALEAPFWAWRTDAARRERVFVRNETLVIDETAIGRVPASPEDSPSGWKLRPRALTLTLFVRLCAADLFIHGIGGAKYDEVTDDIMRRFFGIEPPAFSVVTATLHLPLPNFPAVAADLHAAERLVRDLTWNPQRFPAAQKRFPDLIAAKAKVIAGEPTATSERRKWFHELQELTRKMRPAVAAELENAQRAVAHLQSELAANSVLADREYAWILFPQPALQQFFARILERKTG